MNLFEVLTFFVACFLAFVFGSMLSVKIGLAGWLLGIPLGFLVMMLAINGLRKLLDISSPLRPKCTNGKCDAEDYRFEKRTPAGVVFVCQCGKRYVLKRGRFFEMVSETELRPYMKKNWWGKWQPDKQSEIVSVPKPSE